MTAGLVLAPNMPARTPDGLPISGARLYTYLDGTSTPATVYLDSGLTTPAPNPVTADAGGIFVPLYAATGSTFSTRVEYPDGRPIGGGTYTGVSVSADAAVGAYNTLVANITAEASARQLGDAYLQSQLTALAQSIAGIMAVSDPNTLIWEAYGCVPNVTSFDNYPKFVALAAAIRARGGNCKAIPLTANATWTVWPSALPSNQAVILDLRGVGGVEVDFRGGTITTPQDLIAASLVTYGIYVNGGSVTNPVTRFNFKARFTQTAQPGVRSDAGGLIGIYLQDETKGVYADLEMVGGLAGIICQTITTYNGPDRGQQYRFNIRTKDTFYALNAQGNGDSVEAFVTTRNAGRSVFLYDCRGYRVICNSFGHQGGFNDCLIKVYARPNFQNSCTSDIDVSFTARHAAGEPAESYPICIQFDQDGSNGGSYYPGELSNITITLDIDLSGQTNPGGVVQFTRAGPQGALDTTTVAHSFNNITVKGEVKNLVNGSYTPTLIDFFSG